jgi:hypothetical protein
MGSEMTSFSEASPASEALRAWCAEDEMRGRFVMHLTGHSAVWLAGVVAGQIIPDKEDREAIAAYGNSCSPQQDFSDWGLSA